MRFPTMWYVRPAKPQISLRKSLEYSMTVKLTTEHHLEFLSLKGGCTGSSESALVKMPHCWNLHAMAQIASSNFSFSSSTNVQLPCLAYKPLEEDQVC